MLGELGDLGVGGFVMAGHCEEQEQPGIHRAHYPYPYPYAYPCLHINKRRISEDPARQLFGACEQVGAVFCDITLGMYLGSGLISATELEQRFSAAAHLIDEADSLIIAAGAGMGVDSGLPDFRGESGFWQAYPALGRAKIRFEHIASPSTFDEDPTLAWGFYGHRLNLYRATVPHEGFRWLKTLVDNMPCGGFVFTSNVDGQFQKAGFPEDQVTEYHGSIHHLQCLEPCTDAIWPAHDFHPAIDDDHCRIQNDMPRCIHCGGLARPAILMFGDWLWSEGRTRAQLSRLAAWQRTSERPVLIEIGAGTAIPSVRVFSHRQQCPIIRINPKEFQVSNPADVSIPLGALAGIRGIVSALSGSLDFTAPR